MYFLMSVFSEERDSKKTDILNAYEYVNFDLQDTDF